MQEIKNLTPASAVLSQDDYTYSADGKITTWQQQMDGNTPVLWTEGYDAADQLTSAVLLQRPRGRPAKRLVDQWKCTCPLFPTANSQDHYNTIFSNGPNSAIILHF